jgi:hypothetical protein
MRPAALLILTAGFLVGCAPLGAGVYWPSDRGVVHRPAPPVANARLYHRADQDAARYARDVSRYVRLSPHQQRQVRAILADRAHHLLDRTHPHDHQYVYPFPRQVGERDRTVQRWWRDSDRAIERVMDSHQRRAYRDVVRSYERPSHQRQRPPQRGPVRPRY